MSTVLSTLTAKTADATPKTPGILYADLSGIGNGPWVPTTVAVDATGSVISGTNPSPVVDLVSAAGLAQVHTDLVALASADSALGAQSDGAWSGTGNGGLVGIAKASWSKLSSIASAVAGTLTVAVSNAVQLAAGTNVIGAVTQSGTWTFGATISGIYNNVLPTFSSGQTTQLQTDANGRMLIAGSFSSSTIVTYSSAPPTLTNGGTSPLQGDANGNLMVRVANSSQAVTGTFWQATQPVSGTFWQATQPVSFSGQTVGLSGSLPAFAVTPTVNLGTLNGAAADGTDATGVTQLAGGVGIRGWLSGIYSRLSGTLAVSGTFWQATQPVSAAALPLPTGAATAALQSSIVTALGSPLQAGGSVTEANSAAILANQSTEITALNQLHTDMVAPTPAGTNIIGNMGSINFGPLLVTPTIVNSAYASGNLIGGLQTVSVFRNTTQPSATIDQIVAGWLSGVTVPLTFFIFSKNPQYSTFTDRSALVIDPRDAKYLVTPPFVLTPASAVGSAVSMASSALSLSVQNQDSTVSVNLYVAICCGGLTTPNVGDLFFSISGVKD